MLHYAFDAGMDYSKAWHGPARFAMGEYYFNPHISPGFDDNFSEGDAKAKSIQETIWDGI